MQGCRGEFLNIRSYTLNFFFLPCSSAPLLPQRFSLYKRAIPSDPKPIWLLGLLLDQLGLKLTYRKQGTRGQQVKLFSLSKKELDKTCVGWLCWRWRKSPRLNCDPRKRLCLIFTIASSSILRESSKFSRWVLMLWLLTHRNLSAHNFLLLRP